MVHDENDALARWARARLRAPAMELSPGHRRTFDRLLHSASSRGPGQPIDYRRCQAPKYELLRHLVDHRGYLLHGSREPDIRVFEPRQAGDVYAFSAQQAVYAASDGIWPMVFAIRVRSALQGTFYNGCSRVRRADGTYSPPYYHFAMAADGLRQRPWARGTVYVLPRRTFVPHPPAVDGGLTTTLEEWASAEAVVPVAKVEVWPEEFPFLDEIWGYTPTLLEGPCDWTGLDHWDGTLFPIRPRSALQPG